MLLAWAALAVFTSSNARNALAKKRQALLGVFFIALYRPIVLSRCTFPLNFPVVLYNRLNQNLQARALARNDDTTNYNRPQEK